MVDRKSSSRLGSTATMKTRKPQEDNYILLARGLSARFTGANTPLTPLTQDEMERDLRHMEAFSNACTSYAQQYYIFTNQSNNNNNNKNNNSNNNNNNNSGGSKSAGPNSAGPDGPKSGSGSGSSLQTSVRGPGRAIRNHKGMPIIAMPVRIDPEEEKRLQNLRQKIQQCEAQREIYEGQYLSLRAHYIALSKHLKTKRSDVDSRVSFLQELIRKRGRLLALQRVRIQMVRETLECLRYRMANPSAQAASAKAKEDQADLHALWTSLDQQWKEAEESISKIEASNGLASGSGGNSSSSKDSKENATVANWPASKIPKIPPGVPLLLSQLGQQPGHAVAWGTCGAFGANEDSLVWIHNQIPTERSDRSSILPGLRDDVARLKREIAKEQALNREFQTNAIKMRKENDELVSMMTLLRSETEAVVARHNVLLESEEAKRASKVLYDEEAVVANVADTDAGTTGKKDGESSSGSMAADHNQGSRDATVPKSSGLKEDDENDGDDEGEDGADAEEDEEGEITSTEPGVSATPAVSAGKRALDEGDQQNANQSNNNNNSNGSNGESAASRSKRRKL